MPIENSAPAVAEEDLNALPRAELRIVLLYVFFASLWFAGGAFAQATDTPTPATMATETAVYKRFSS